MQEVDEGRAKLTSLAGITGSGGTDVAYSIVFTTTLRTVRPGFPPVADLKANVHYIRAVDGSSIPEGEYLLHREHEINRVKNLGFSWHVLSWPR